MNYIVYANIGTDVTLAGDTIAKTTSVSKTHLAPKVSNINFGGAVQFTGLSDFHIKRARLKSNLPGIVSGSDEAMTVKLELATYSSGTPGTTRWTFDFIISNWNDWESVDLFVSASALKMDALSSTKPFDLFISGAYTIMDFNVQEDFVGQDVSPVLELEIEANAILDASTSLEI